MTRFIYRHGPLVLLLLPYVMSEFIAVPARFIGESMIGHYLFKQPPGGTDPGPAFLVFSICLQALILVVNFFYLLPAIRANRLLNADVPSTNKELQIGRNRIYNAPSFFVGMTYIGWLSSFAVLIGMLPPGPKSIVIALGLLTTTLAAIVIFYCAETINRFYLIPYWFKDGRVRLTFRFKKPSLYVRFFDIFVVVGFLPGLAVCGLLFISADFAEHDPDMVRRLFFVCASIVAAFWFFGIILLYLNAITFIGPLNRMETAASELARENFDVRVSVHSDDQIGRLEQAINQMATEMKEKRLIKTLFGHYVSPIVRDMILDGKIKTDGETIEAVVLFSDIRSFTQMSEMHPPESIVKLLNAHFSRVVGIVSQNNGFVDKFIGDAVMAVFDSSFCAGMHRYCALAAAAQILASIEETNAEIALMQMAPLTVGVGLACGSVIRGNIGSDSRRELTVIGHTVNIASRLESATKEVGFPLVITADTFDQSCESIDSIRVEKRMKLRVRGSNEEIEVIAMGVL